MFQRRYEREIITLDGIASTEWARWFFSNEIVRMECHLGHLEQTGNCLWTMLLRRFGDERPLVTAMELGIRCARLVY